MLEKTGNIPFWTIKFLKYTAFYHLAWGVFILSQPSRFWSFFQPESSNFPNLIYLLGISLLIMGIAYLYIAKKPFTLFWFLLFAVFAKVIGFALALILADETTPLLNLILHIIFNDLLWIPFLFWIFYLYFKEWQNAELENENLTPFSNFLKNYQTNRRK